MKVTDLQAYLLSSPLPQPITWRCYRGEHLLYKRDALLIRIRTDQGLFGYAPGPASQNAFQLINRNLRSAVINTDPTKIEALRKKILERRPQFPGLSQAYGAVEIALFDLKAKAEGCPVSELLGGRVRNWIRLYGSAGIHGDAEKCAEEASVILKMGFDAYKMRVRRGPEEDLEAIGKVRTALPSMAGLMVDASAWWSMEEGKYSFEQVQQLTQAISRQGLTWLEDPIAFQDHEAYSKLKELRREVPIAAGKHETDAETLLSLASNDNVDVVQANLVRQGGYIACREVLRAVQHSGRSFAFDNCGTPLELLVMAQLGICFDEKVVPWLEWPCFSNESQPGMYPFSLGDEILKEPISIDNGGIVVPHSSGLGIAVNEAVITRYPWKPGPESIFRPRSARSIGLSAPFHKFANVYCSGSDRQFSKSGVS